MKHHPSVTRLHRVFQILAAAAAPFLAASGGPGCGGNVVVGSGSGGAGGGSTATSTLNACEQAVADIKAKAESCGVMLTVTSTGTAECTPSDGKLATCVVACFAPAPCDCIGYGNANNCSASDAQKYSDCVSACQ